MVSRIQESALTRRTMVSSTAAAAATILYHSDSIRLSCTHLEREDGLTDVRGEIVKSVFTATVAGNANCHLKISNFTYLPRGPGFGYQVNQDRIQKY